MVIVFWHHFVDVNKMVRGKPYRAHARNGRSKNQGVRENRTTKIKGFKNLQPFRGYPRDGSHLSGQRFVDVNKTILCDYSGRAIQE